jgi:hypothetical protein
MTEANGMEAKTIHRLLEVDPSSGVAFNSACISRTSMPITPQPPPATPLADWLLTSMPPACQMEIVTV